MNDYGFEGGQGRDAERIERDGMIALWAVFLFAACAALVLAVEVLRKWL